MSALLLADAGGKSLGFISAPAGGWLNPVPGQCLCGDAEILITTGDLLIAPSLAGRGDQNKASWLTWV